MTELPALPPPEPDPADGRPRLLIVDDDEGILRALESLFRRAGHRVACVQDPTLAAGVLEEESPDVVLCDLRMPRLSGLDLLVELKAKRPGTEVILMTAYADVRAAVEAVKRGAYDFLVKPFEDISVVELAVARAAERKKLREDHRALSARVEALEAFEGLVGESPRMTAIYQMVETVARSDATVLLGGESGTGKELVARAIHLRSERRAQPFLAVNCSALPAGLLESELFGHVKGAFTGAVCAKKGLFEAADHGTLFLDEVADLPPPAQVQLLRVLQEGEVRRVGGNDIVRVDVRVVAATNTDLEEARARGNFREDLYYRLAVITLKLPPLRERVEDIPLLVHHFLARAAARARKPPPELADDVLPALRRYPWPGNVRELENAIERAVILARGPIGVADLPPHVARPPGKIAPEVEVLSDLPYLEARRSAMHAFELRYLGALLRKAAGNVSEAARLAGMDRSNLRRLLRQHGIDATGSGQTLRRPDGA